MELLKGKRKGGKKFKQKFNCRAGEKKMKKEKVFLMAFALLSVLFLSGCQKEESDVNGAKNILKKYLQIFPIYRI